MIERGYEVESPPCGVPGHERGHWEDVVLGIWWCPDCGTEIWATEEVDGADADMEGPSADERRSRPGASSLPLVRAAAADAGDPAGASGARASEAGLGWRDRDGGTRLWHLILDAFGRAAR